MYRSHVKRLIRRFGLDTLVIAMRKAANDRDYRSDRYEHLRTMSVIIDRLIDADAI